MLTEYERFALDHYLVSYPKEIGFYEILSLLEREDNLPLNRKSVVPNIEHEKDWGVSLAYSIKKLKHKLKEKFKSRE